MPQRGRGRGRYVSGLSDSKPSVKGISGSKSKASEGARQSVPRAVSSLSSSSSSSSSLPTGSDSDMDSDNNYEYNLFANHDFRFTSDYGDSDDSDGQIGVFQPTDEGKKIAAIAYSLPYHGLMMLLFETPSGFALFTFNGVYCHLDSAVDNIWAEFGDHLTASMMVYPKGFLSFEDKSRAISADTGVDNQLADLIKKWHRPEMNLCVGRPEYKTIIESVLKIPCMCCQTVLEIMWGIQQHMCTLVPREKLKLTKEDRLPTSQGLMKFLSNCGFDVKPEMVNEKIVSAACTLFHCDVDDEKKLGVLRDAGLHIRDISGIACEDWDILKLAIAVKVICCPKEELTDFHEVLAEDVVSQLKGDARKYKGIAVKTCWLNTYHAVVSNHRLRIAKRKLLESSFRKAKKGESQQIAQDHVTSESKAVWVLRRSPRLDRKLHENSGEDTPHKRPKH